MIHTPNNTPAFRNTSPTKWNGRANACINNQYKGSETREVWKMVMNRSPMYAMHVVKIIILHG
eukprot:scaffold3088_cov169-Ochromonas_danica.AAC.3